MRPTRSLLLVPALRPDVLDDPRATSADAVVFDLAEALPSEARRRGRDNARERGTRDPARSCWLRAPALLAEGDVDAVGTAAGVIATDIRSPEDIMRLDHALAACEGRHGFAPGSIEVIVELDNAKAVFFADRVAAASSRVVSLCFNGSEHGALHGDLASDWSIDGPELMFSRQYALVAARAADMDCPLDGPFARIDDLDGLKRDTAVSRNLGYRGRIVLGPKQIEAVNRVYSPTAEEVAYHQRVLATLETAIAQGRASVTLDGKMIDYAHAATARAVIDQARAWGIAP
jgi:citrate lyase subunit beta/citryl-CoA lyase